MDERDWLAERFEEHRTRLRAVAYRMLGSLSEADDAVQEAWLRLSRADTGEIENLGGWLTTVVARVSLNMLRSRKVRREEPLEVHMPEPIVDRADGIDPEHEALLADSVGLALLVVLETLSPPERLAFVLHDMFAVPVRRDRADRRPLARGGAPARQPRAPARPGREDGSRRGPRHPARGRRRVPRGLRATATSRRCSRCSTRTSCCARTSVPTGGSREVRGARQVAGQALFYSRLGLVMRPALVNGAAGAVGRPGRRAVLGRCHHGQGRQDRRDRHPRRPRAAPSARPDDPRRLTHAQPTDVDEGSASQG